MKPKICSHRAAAEFLGENPKTYDVILIVNTGRKYDNEEYLSEIKRQANRVCELMFDDIEFHRDNHRMVEPSQVREAVNFAADKDNLVVCCTAGMGRSAALAYVVACSKMEPAEAVTILDPNRHTPNEKVIFLGDTIVDAPTMLECYARFKDEMGRRYTF
jgi:predicted protein tyrosine phosphatase